MVTQNASAPSEPRLRYWLRVLRPLTWWLLLVLVLYGIRTHQRLSETTLITFEPTLGGRAVGYDATVILDKNQIVSGRRLSIGPHKLVVTHPKTKTFITNLFIWYGHRDLGEIPLERTTGRLVINANPNAQQLTIRGPEFAVTLTNTSGFTSSVPTDSYVIEAAYKYWKGRDSVTVFPDQSAFQTYTPNLGALRLEASHQDVNFQIFTTDRRLLDRGSIPAMVSELPEGNYRLISTRKSDEREMQFTISTRTTNQITVNFVYGAAVLESDPSGAAVVSGRKELGVTPLTLPELKPGEFEFSLRLNEYEPITGSFIIAANQTNGFRTNLVSRQYTRAMQHAKELYAERSFESAANSAGEALKHKPNDLEAKRLQRDADGHAHLVRAKALGQRGDYVVAIKAANVAIELLNESADAKTLLDELTKGEQEYIAAEQKRQAEVAEQERKRKEAELATQRRQQNINRLNAKFYELNRRYKNDTSFIRHDLVATNAANSTATAINSALVGGLPIFVIVKYEWPQADMFTIQARHRIGIGYRECLIVGGQAAEGEMHVYYKVFEYENPPDLNLLNGLLTATSSITVTSQDPNVEKRKAERFQERIKEGAELVKKRIESAIKTP